MDALVATNGNVEAAVERILNMIGWNEINKNIQIYKIYI